ncbi:hypothetical protein BS47DRAFT_715579 [Hydnum rufescens UP504]|uniref:Impact N-terminal domain-containing protein n=1 Tax=Hydnum rufescens UP504 TaxID=1448309 RepID=A0A9P6B1Z6_9AGAM|nr:hypothetical protein BS47DRAFT_715579 [Hydnum rufescens UP504]
MATLNGYIRSSRAQPKSVSVSNSITDRNSTFKATIYRATSAAEARACVGHTRNVLHASNPASHEMSAWRCMVLKSGHDGLAGPEDFEVQSGAEDDKEQYGGGKILRTMVAEGVIDAVVVCSRWYGGTFLGPVRFTHIETCTREVCRTFKVIEQVEECIQELDKLDVTLADLRANLAAVTESTSGSTKPAVPKGKDYSSLLDPPDLPKAKRLVNARNSAINGIRALLLKHSTESSAIKVSFVMLLFEISLYQHLLHFV